MSTNRSIVTIGAAILGLVVLGVAVVLLAEGRQPPSFEAGSPQAAMHDYLTAWEDDDYAAAYGFFSNEIKASASLDEYESQARIYGSDSGVGGSRAAFIDSVEGDAQRVTLHLTVEEYYGDGPGSNSFRSTREVRMVHEADGWKIDEPLIGLEPIPFSEVPF